MMTPLATVMKAVFILAWGVAVSAWIYGTMYWLPARFSKSKSPPGYMRKALIGYGIFVAAIAVGLAAGGIAELWGGGWQ
jgi:hypothetical protein